MPALMPALRVLLSGRAATTWTAGTSLAMTARRRGVLAPGTARRLDGVIACALFVAAVAAALIYLRGMPLGHFYQEEFGPAVVLACAEKIAVPETSAALTDFLQGHSQSFDCADLPPVTGAPFSIWQRQHLYLVLAAGIVWSLAGVWWHALALISALLAGGFVVAVYAVGRLFLPASWAAAVALAAALSPYHARMLPEVRDYSKAAFIVAIVWFGCRLAAPAPSGRRSLLIGALAGIVTGVGFGFRPDLATAVPFVLMVLLLVLIGTRSRAWRHVLFAAAAFAFAFAAAGAPMLAAYGRGGVLGFAALNGLTTPFAAELGLSEPPYDIGQLFLDNYINALVHGYAAKFSAPGEWPDYLAQYPHYGGYSVRAFLEYARHFPADMLIRAYASILKVLSPHTRDVALTPLNPGLVLTLLALALVAADAPLVSMALGLAIVYFSGLGALQFHPRHLFHLEFFSWLAAAVVGVTVLRVSRREWSLAQLRAGAWVPLAGILAAALLLMGLRVYQQHAAASLFEEYLRAERQALPLQEERQGNAVLLQVNGAVPDMTGAPRDVSEPTRRGYYLHAVLDERRCALRTLTLRIAYTVTADDFSRDLVVTTGAAAETHVFFPVFTDAAHRFAGIELAPEHRPCLAGLDAVVGYKALPLPLWLRLRSDWRGQPLYQSIVW
jgi:hypothetical protein